MNANGQPSEYAFQAEFVTIFKHLLLLAYADLKYRVLVEVKERDNSGNRRQRLDILVRDSSSLPAYGFELVVAASKEEFDDHCKRSQTYAKLHHCSMYMINLCTQPEMVEYFGRGYQNVTPVNIVVEHNGNTGEAWMAMLIYGAKDRERISIKSSEWEMIFDSTLQNVV
jgi:hypothetical protein